jgi:putative transposase
LNLSIGDESVRKAWKSALLSDTARQQLLKDSLSSWTTRLSRSRRKRGWDIAIDLLHEPYYGQASQEVFRGAYKQGTRRFWSLATAAIVNRGERFTLAIAAVRNNRMAEVLEALWPQLEALNLRVRRLLLDRGFYSAKVVRWLKVRQIPFLMPMIRRGAVGRGTRPFFRRGRTGFARYQWRERDHGEFVEVGVAMVPARDRRHGPHVYIYGGRPPCLERCQETYRRRFGIESSYRQCHQSLGWTTSRNADWRRFLMVLSFVVRNLWVCVPSPEPSPRRSSRLTYPMFLARLAQLSLAPPLQSSTATRLAEGP